MPPADGSRVAPAPARPLRHQEVTTYTLRNASPGTDDVSERLDRAQYVALRHPRWLDPQDDAVGPELLVVRQPLGAVGGRADHAASGDVVPTLRVAGRVRRRTFPARVGVVQRTE